MPSAGSDHHGQHPRPDVRADHRADLADVQVRQTGSRARSRSASASARSALARWWTATSTVLVPALPTAISSRRAIALAAVRTFSSGSIRPSTRCSNGFTASAEPSIAAAAPIRPPRRR